MAMLSKIRNRAGRPLWGAVVLAIAVPLAIPAAASASTIQGTPLNAIPFSPFNPQARTYTNLDQALSEFSEFTDVTVAWQLDQSSAPELNAVNHVNTVTATCIDCNAYGIAFQVVYVSKQQLTALNASNTTYSRSDNCVRCNTLAVAYQFIVAGSSPGLCSAQVTALNQVGEALGDLRTSGDTPGQLVTATGTLAGQIESILANPPACSGGSAVTPAVNGSGLPGELTGTNGPIVDMFRSIEH
jgi:hypothetical protein